MALSAEIVQRIKDAVGSENASTDDFVLVTYAKSIDHTQGWKMPGMVVKPRNAEQVASILRICNEYKVPVIPRGGGTSLTQGVFPVRDDTLVMDLMGMNKIHEINTEVGYAIVDVGVTWGQLDKELRQYGFYVGQGAAGAGSGTAIGGGLSQNSVGAGGSTKHDCASYSCIGLEVALVSGEIIRTGAWLNKYVTQPFKRYGLGPDWTGLFLGDPGTLGVKTKAVMKIYPRPPYHRCKTFKVPGGVENAGKVLQAWHSGEWGIWEAVHIPTHVANIFGGLEVYKPFANTQDDVLFYVTQSFTEEGLNANVRELDKIALDHGCEPYGDEISEGNLAKYHYEEQGYWRFYHPFWGILGPNSSLMVWVFDVAVNEYASTAKILIDWYEKNIDRFLKMPGGFGYVGFLTTTGVKVVSGCPSIDDSETMKLRREVYEEGIEIFLRDCHGFPGWSDMAYSRKAVDIGAYTPEHIDFMRSIKNALDPNGILSPGKFYFGKDGR